MYAKALAAHEPAHYHLQLQGRLSVDWSSWLTDVAVVYEGDGQLVVITITGTVRDQAGLFGLLSFVRDLGARLIVAEWIRSSTQARGNQTRIKPLRHGVLNSP